MSDRTKGLLLGLGASLAWGTAFLCARYLTDMRGGDPVALAAGRFAFAGCLLLAYCAATGRGRRLLAAMDDAPRFLLLGFLSVVGVGYMVFVAAHYTYSAVGVLLMNSNGIFIAALASMAGERVPLIRYGGLALGLVGCFLVIGGQDPSTPEQVNHVAGGGAALLAALSWALYTLLGKAAVERWGGVVATTVALSMGACLMILINLLRGTVPSLGGPDLLVLLYFALVPTALGFVAWYAALHYVPANLIGPLQYVAPVVGISLGWAVLDEPIGWAFAGGAVLIFAGVWIATGREKAR